MPGEDEGADMIPRARLNEEIAKTRRAREQAEASRAELAAAQAQIKALQPKADGYETLTDQIKDLKGQLEGEKAGRAEDQVIRSAGFEDPALVRFEHSRLGDGAPAMADWLEQLQKKPDEAPSSLRGWLGEASGDGSGDDTQNGSGDSRSRDTSANTDPSNGTGRQRGGTSARSSRGTSGGRAPSAGSSEVTEEQLRAAKERGTKLGDWSEYRRLRGFEQGA